MEKLRTMNPEQIAALFRTVLQVVGGIIATWGFMSDAQWTAVSGGILTIAITVWGMYARRDVALISSASDVPAVHAIVADPAVANEALATKLNVIPPAPSR